jgi:thymidylate synthase
MYQYISLVQEVLSTGSVRGDRTGTGTLSVFGKQMSFNLDRDAFPLVTTKKTFWRGIVVELLWMLSGSTNIAPLVKQGVSIWTDWPLKHYNTYDFDIKNDCTKEEFEARILEDEAFAKNWGELGPVYGKQWRNVNGIDQLAEARKLIMTQPDSRRILVNSWNVAEIPYMIKSGLPPCHCFFQFYCEDDYLDIAVYIRSNDLFLGTPFNIAQYALLLSLMAHSTGRKPRRLHYYIGDAHLYLNHVEQAKEMVKRTPLPRPTLAITSEPKEDLAHYTYDEIKLLGYTSHPHIEAPIAV